MSGQRCRPGGELGQSSVELLGVLALLIVIAAAASQALAWRAAREAAGSAAQAGAMALLQGGDPVRAARSAVPGWARGRVSVVVAGHSVRVTIAPRELVPLAAALGPARARADAGTGAR